MNADVLLEHFHRLGDAPDAVPRLRRFILDLAVRGKLVEQNVQEGEALALLPKLHSGKARLLQQGAIRKPRELEPGQEQEPPFHIPASWHWCRLDEVGAIVGGGTPTSTNADFYTDGGKGIGWLTPADLGRNKAAYVSHGAKDLTEAGLAASSASLLPAGSVVFSSRAPIGYTAIASRALTTNQGFKSVVPYITECNSYIAIYFKAFTPEIEDKASGTTFKEVSAKQVAGLPFPLPPLPEQQRIVAKVDELMALCDRLEAAQQEREKRRTRLTAASWQALTPGQSPGQAVSDPSAARFALEQMPALTTRPQQIAALRQTILDLAVRGRLVKQDSTDEPVEAKGDSKKGKSLPPLSTEDTLFDAPTSWKWFRLGGIAQFLNGDRGKNYPNKSEYVASGLAWINTGHIRPDGSLSMSGMHYITRKKFDTLRGGKIEPDDLVYCLRGATLGKTAYVEPFTEGAVASSLVIIRLNPALADKRFIYRYLMSSFGRDQIWTFDNGSAQPNLSANNVKLYAIPLPPLAEQRRIVAKVDELMRLCDALEATLVQGEITKGKLLEAVLHSEAAPRTRPTAPVQQVVPRPAKQRATYTEPETELALAAEPMAPAFQTPLRRLRGRPAKNGPLTTSATHLIREHLHNHPGLHGKSAIVEATGVDAAAWNAAIKELLAEGSVVREGEKKGARYKAKK